MTLPSLLLLYCVTCAQLGPSGEADLRAAGLAFSVPSNFEVLAPKAPALLDAVARRLATEIVRFRVFVVPCESGSSLDKAAEEARRVALRYTWGLRSEPFVKSADETEALLRVDVDARQEATLCVRRMDDRYFAIAITARRERTEDSERDDSSTAAAPVLEEFRKSVAGTTTYPADAGQTFSVAPYGLRFDVPLRYWTGTPQASLEGDTVVVFEAPWHFGLDSRYTALIDETDLDLTLEDAAKRYRDRMIAIANAPPPPAPTPPTEPAVSGASDDSAAEEGQVPPPLLPPPTEKDEALQSAGPGQFQEIRFESAPGKLPSWRFDFRVGDDLHQVLIVDGPRHRLRIEHRCRVSRGPFFAKAIERAFQSVEAIPRRLRRDTGLDAEPESTLTDAESGFSFRAPEWMVANPGAEGVAAWREPDARPPATTLTIRLAEDDASEPDDDTATAERAAKRLAIVAKPKADEGWRIVAEPSLRSYGGKKAARFALERETDRGLVRDVRTLIFGDGRSFEISTVALATDYEALGESLDTAIATFRAVPRDIAITLGPPIAVGDTGYSVRVPEDWKLVSTGERSNSYAPASEQDGVLVTIESRRPYDVGARGNPLEMYRRDFESDLSAAGATDIRMEDAEIEGRKRHDVMYRTAYSVDGVPMRELRRAYFDDRHVVVVAGRCRSDRYRSWKAALDRILDSLDKGPAAAK